MLRSFSKIPKSTGRSYRSYAKLYEPERLTSSSGRDSDLVTIFAITITIVRLSHVRCVRYVCRIGWVLYALVIVFDVIAMQQAAESSDPTGSLCEVYRIL
jgi:hypothetical protein